VVQCCKNCLLVIFTVCSLQSLHGVRFTFVELAE
jgi:hypothetical protein